MQKTYVLAICVLAVSVLVAGTAALLVIPKNIHSTGSIKALGLGVYRDPQCVNATSSLDFGSLEPGFSKNFTLYLRNEGNSPLTLNMTWKNWNPLNAANYITLAWNREGQQIVQNEVISFVITVSVSSSIQGISSFELDIVISGIG